MMTLCQDAKTSSWGWTLMLAIFPENPFGEAHLSPPALTVPMTDHYLVYADTWGGERFWEDCF